MAAWPRNFVHWNGSKAIASVAVAKAGSWERSRFDHAKLDSTWDCFEGRAGKGMGRYAPCGRNKLFSEDALKSNNLQGATDGPERIQGMEG